MFCPGRDCVVSGLLSRNYTVSACVCTVTGHNKCCTGVMHNAPSYGCGYRMRACACAHACACACNMLL